MKDILSIDDVHAVYKLDLRYSPTTIFTDDSEDDLKALIYPTNIIIFMFI
jgi:hypothetical protein